jgi:nicotinamide riboside transporter PnuC
VVFEVVSREVSGLEVELLVVGVERQQVVNLLGILPLEFTTGMGGVVALRRRRGTVHGLSSVVLVLLQAVRGGFLGVVTEVVFVVVIMVGKMA